MYGTVARLRARPGVETKFGEVFREFETAKVAGAGPVYLFRMDADANEYYLVVTFADKETYLANADSPEQDERYRRIRELLEVDPEWHDGEIVHWLGAVEMLMPTVDAGMVTDRQ